MKKILYTMVILPLFFLLLITNILCSPKQKELARIESKYIINLDEKNENNWVRL